MAESPTDRDPGTARINPASLRLYADPAYEAPTANDLRALMRRSGLTASQVGDLVGVDSDTVRTWTEGERAMPYSAWRLLLVESTGMGPDGSCEFVTSIRGVGVVFASAGREWLVSQEALDDHFAAESIGNEAAFSRGRRAIRAAIPRATAKDANGRLIIRTADLE